MAKTEKAIVTVLCMVYDKDKILLQNRVKEDWQGLTFPGGHVEHAESFVDALKREVKEETGLDVECPILCGIKQFQTDDDERYIVLLFKTDKYSGTLTSSAEGEMVWIERSQLGNHETVSDFFDLLKVFDREDLTEFMYVRDDENDWQMKIQ